MMKLDGSLDDARARALETPDTFKVGAHGWVTVLVKGDAGPTLKDLSRWVQESHAALQDGGKPRSTAARKPKEHEGKARPTAVAKGKRKATTIKSKA